jgi:hypothetical protein
MKTRIAVIATGQKFTVPQGIQRLDSSSTRGWQVRYQGTKYFPDGAIGPKKALENATKELAHRMATMPVSIAIRTAPAPGKRSNLPVGISGPIIVAKKNEQTQSAVLSISIPRFGGLTQTKKVHIGTAQTYTKARFREALVKAIAIRAEAMAVYEAAATKATRKAASDLKKAIAQAKR